ncbi:uncharacterized protein [Physcomitrium patens]|uniref:uncharacterized protein isoform X3 n=1 Tax=Physcomitrium patens TaxID=3218 RepID=UPI003CCDE156
MDHKRGYEYLEDQTVPSPTKRLKNWSHHREYPCHRGLVTQDSQKTWPNSGRAPPLGERCNAQIYLSQHKPQIKLVCPQDCHGRENQKVNTPKVVAAKVEIPSSRHAPGSVSTGEVNAKNLEKNMEEAAYQSMLPTVRKELEKWTFCKNRAPRQGLLLDTSSDESEDETTCAVCRNPRKFKGWDALLIHAQKYTKQMPRQHRGYFRALEEALLDKKMKAQEQAVSDQTSHLPTPCGRSYADITHKMDAEHMKQEGPKSPECWRSEILMVENKEFSEMNHILTQQELESPHPTTAEKPRLQEVLAVYTHGDGDAERHVFVFPASKVGHDLHSSEMDNDEHRLSTESKSSLMKDDVARCESLKEALGFQLTLNDHGDTPGERLTDLDQIRRTSCVVNRWAENFKSCTQRFKMKRVFRDSPRLIAIDEVFREDLRLIKRYSPTCEKKIEEHMSRIEDSFRTKHLMRLQDIEEVREQFQDFADNMQQKDTREKFSNMKAELERSKRMCQKEKEERSEALRAAQAKAMQAVRHRKAEQRAEREHMMEVWMEDAKVFRKESWRAREERHRLETIHRKVHARAQTARKECPVCRENFRVDEIAKTITRSW